MDKKEVEDKIIELAEKEFKIKIDSNSLNSSLIMDLNLDSLSLVELIMSIEETFSINIPEPATSKLGSIQDIVNYTHELITAQSQQ